MLGSPRWLPHLLAVDPWQVPYPLWTLVSLLYESGIIRTRLPGQLEGLKETMGGGRHRRLTPELSARCLNTTLLGEHCSLQLFISSQVPWEGGGGGGGLLPSLSLQWGGTPADCLTRRHLKTQPAGQMCPISLGGHEPSANQSQLHPPFIIRVAPSPLHNKSLQSIHLLPYLVSSHRQASSVFSSTVKPQGPFT